MEYDIWIALFALMGVLLIIRTIMNKTNKRTVMRVNPDTVKASKDIILRVLPLVEDDSDSLRGIHVLPCDKERVKSAAKVMAYCFNRNSQYEELARVRRCFVNLARFQDDTLDEEERVRLAEREQKQLTREIDTYLAKHFG